MPRYIVMLTVKQPYPGGEHILLRMSYTNAGQCTGGEAEKLPQYEEIQFKGKINC
jgi:hypothetical protein